MGMLEENSVLEALECGKNFSYIINDTKLFSNMDYKVLQSNESSSFIKCMKMLYNGKIQLLYLTSEYRPFGSIIHQLDSDSFLSVVANIVDSVCEVKSNGFLRCENIDLSIEHIYIEPSTYKAFLLYVPLIVGMQPNEQFFENALRSSFAKIILGLPTISTPKTMQLLANLQNASIPIERLLDGVLTGNNKIIHSTDNKPSKVRFVSLNAGENISLLMDKTEYVLGRGKKADGLVAGSKMVGRTHCKVYWEAGKCKVQDLMSGNGTFVNQQRIPPGADAVIRHGDILRLANIDLEVVFE